MGIFPLVCMCLCLVFDGDGDDCNNDTHRTCAVSMYHCLHEFIHLAHARYPLMPYLYLYFHLYFCREESYDSLTYIDMVTFNKQSLTPFFLVYQNIGSCCWIWICVCICCYVFGWWYIDAVYLHCICICIYGCWRQEYKNVVACSAGDTLACHKCGLHLC